MGTGMNSNTVIIPVAEAAKMISLYNSEKGDDDKEFLEENFLLSFTATPQINSLIVHCLKDYTHQDYTQQEYQRSWQRKQLAMDEDL